MGIVLTSTIDIAATPEQVWDVLSDFDSYGQWSNFSRVSGTATKGTRLSIRMPGMSFRPFVTAAVPNQELEWSATIASERFFVGRHTFTLDPERGRNHPTEQRRNLLRCLRTAVPATVHQQRGRRLRLVQSSTEAAGRDATGLGMSPSF